MQKTLSINSSFLIFNEEKLIWLLKECVSQMLNTTVLESNTD